MKRFLSHFSIGSRIAAYTAALALLLVVLPAVALASFSPDRPTKVYNGPGTPGFDKPTFNSFTNVPNIGDERTFFNGMYPGGTALTDPLAQVQSGDVLTLQVYVHNDADPSLGAAGVAKNTSVKVVLPSGIAKSQQASATISASNAASVSDTLDFGAANGGFFQLQYVPGSAHVRGNYINTSLPDSLVTTGATIGTNALDGNLKGCFQQEVLVTLQVKVNMPQYQIEKHVRAAGATSWDKTVTSKPGDTDQWLITFNNNGQTALNAVNVVDQVPAGLTVVPGSVKLINGNYPNGYTYPSNAIQDNGRTVNVGLGNYDPGINAFVRFDTKVDTPASNVCGTETLTNKAFATPQGFGAIWDTANVVVDSGKQCNVPTPTYTCDAFHVTPGDNRTVKVDTFKTSQTNGATFNNVVISWGDNTTPLTTNTAVGQTHQYSKDGTYTLNAVAHFTVNNKDVTASGVNCTQTVTFTTPGTTPPPTTTPPNQLVNTGPGQVVGLFAAVTIAGAFAHRLFLSRRLARQ